MARVAILGAMPQEIEAYDSQLDSSGNWRDHEVSLDVIGIGKVNAAAKTAKIIGAFRPDYMILTGLAGSLKPSVRRGNIVVGLGAIDVDFDAKDFDQRLRLGQIPFEEGRVRLSDPRLVELAMSYSPTERFRVIPGYIATADRFFGTQKKQKFYDACWEFRENLGLGHRTPNVCDMESAAFLQVANAEGVPSLVVRAVSDGFKGDSASDFNEFLTKAIDHYVSLVDHVLSRLS